MDALEDILIEYINMRKNGMDSSSVLAILRVYVEPLSKAEKKELANQIRLWEKKPNIPNTVQTSTPTPPSNTPDPKPSPIKPLQPPVPIPTTPPKAAIKSLKASTQADPQPMQEAEWVTCATCGKTSRTDAIFCYSCGQILDQTQGQFGTKRFTEAVAVDSSFFGPDSLLVLKIRDAEYDYDLRPQLSDHELIIGRSTEKSAVMPDVDLAECNGEKLGVSRLHVAIRYLPEDKNIQVYDLGSANGTFVNGQKLTAKEMRILRNGDQIRLGKLVIRADFLHPGEEVR